MSIEDEFPPETELHLDSVLADAYTRLRARAVEMERAQQWRPIEEAPKDDKEILAWSRRHGSNVGRLTHYKKPEMPSRRGGWFLPTHFCPLQPAPEPHQNKP